jgi:23S rRNA (cytidine1920-2'-O)/16S rRNA (cytidine1409-2'-O)-methyltransferase
VKRRFVSIAARLRRERPDVHPTEAIAAGRVFVGGVPISNPNAMVDAHAPLVVEEPRELRGTIKLRAALDAFGVDVNNRVCLDLGASTGGFTVALLERGAKRVYAVDVGYGQLLGRLRLDARVVNLERTNVSEVQIDRVDVITMDLSYLSISSAIAQLKTEASEFIALVKPLFEVGSPDVDEAIKVACIGVESAGWRVVNTMRSPVTGARGSVEGWLHAVRK